MKSRLGFVSNSSSTSFFCNICSEERESYMCDYDPTDMDMYGCKNGHVFDISCLPEGTRISIEESGKEDSFPIELCPICNFEIIPDHLLIEYIKRTTDLRYFVSEIKTKFHNIQELTNFLYPSRIK